ncbi:MAG: gamma carbonic anhydrase family protein [Burkholderiaceae bacterium]
MSKPSGPITAPFAETSPSIATLAFAGEGAAILGRATLGTDAWLGDYSVIRADGNIVVIGNDFHLGAHGTVHIAHDMYATHVGDHVSAGAEAVLHACTIGSDCVIERAAVVLDGSKIGSGAVVTAGSVVYPRSDLEGGWIYTGSPAKPVARVTPDELEARHRSTRGDSAARRLAPVDPGAETPDCFVAPSARLGGEVRAGAEAGIWYGCYLNAGSHRIEIGAGTNVQDNSFLICEQTALSIAENVSIGHNVTLVDCRIETNTLIGIGSRLAAGTVVESDVLVAAGAQTEPGQRLTGGQVWGGRPARPIGPMDERKRKIVAGTLPAYRAYAKTFRATPHLMGPGSRGNLG